MHMCIKYIHIYVCNICRQKIYVIYIYNHISYNALNLYVIQGKYIL